MWMKPWQGGDDIDAGNKIMHNYRLVQAGAGQIRRLCHGTAMWRCVIYGLGTGLLTRPDQVMQDVHRPINSQVSDTSLLAHHKH